MKQSKLELINSAFSKAIEAGLTPDIDRMLQQVPEESREQLFGRLIRTEIALKSKQGKSVQYEEYLIRYPECVDTLIEAFSELQHGITSEKFPPPIPVASRDATPSGQIKGKVNANHDIMVTATHVPGVEIEANERNNEPSGNGSFLLKSTANVSLKLEDLQQRLTAFELEKEIGSGGQGAVFRARRCGTGELVAIKVLATASTQKSAQLSLFMREASVLSKLRHRRIVQFHEVGQVEGAVYIVMEYIDGLVCSPEQSCSAMRAIFPE